MHVLYYISGFISRIKSIFNKDRSKRSGHFKEKR